jgi:HD-GYP domain-containing protein (c-di-GMP phosphodiesterase class II)
MKLFKISKKNDYPHISTFLTSIDGKVIARKGDIPNPELINKIAILHPNHYYDDIKLAQTHLYFHFAILLNQMKYGFITDSEVSIEKLLSIIGQVQINELMLKEFKWMMKYEYFYHHSLAITSLVTRMALDFWNDVNLAVEAASCALTHHIGVTRIPSEILQKVSKLTEEEMKIIQEHPIYSYFLLIYYTGNLDSKNAIIAYEHHEDPLGTGYPRGIKQDAILVQMLKMNDIFDALITNRPFRPALSLKEALEVFEKDVEAGRISPELPVLLRSYLLPYVSSEPTRAYAVI